MLKLFYDRRLGAEVRSDGRTAFTVWAPWAESVTVGLVSPHRRRIELQARNHGYHEATVEGVAADSQYFVHLHKRGPNGEDRQERWPDPASRFQPEGVHGPSQVLTEAFDWQDAAWSGIPLSRYIISEIHVGTFTPAGTFEAVIAELDRMADLGFTALELMPVAQFPGGRNWGYDGVYPFAVQNTYGGPIGLKRLVDACHRRGLAVILDVVYNHLGPEGNYLPKFGPYFTENYRTPWGEAVNLDGAQSGPVRRYFIENALQWVSEFHIDALRLDAVHAIYDFSARHFLQELAAAVHRIAEEMNRRVYCIAESALNDSRVVRSRALGGLGLDAQWNDDFHHALHTLLTRENQGYYQDYGRIEDFAKAWHEGYVYTGAYSRFRQRRHGNSSHEIDAGRFVVFSQNHDQVGNRMYGDRLAAGISFEKQKLTAAAVLLTPYIPLLFMGEEYGETAPFPYFVSHGDPELVAAVREGRRREFAGFRWQGEPWDPQAQKTFEQARIRPELAAKSPHRELLAFTRELIRLRTTLPCLRRLSKKSLQTAVTPDRQTLCVHRWSPLDEAVALFHFGNGAADILIALPEGQWQKTLDSSDRRWKGPGSPVSQIVAAQTGPRTRIELSGPGAVLLWRRSPDKNKK